MQGVRVGSGGEGEGEGVGVGGGGGGARALPAACTAMWIAELLQSTVFRTEPTPIRVGYY